MSKIININEFKTSDKMPITEEDFNNLDNYKFSTLFRVLKSNKKYQKKLLDNIFIRLVNEEEINSFINYLV